MISTHDDWNPENVDLFTVNQAAKYIGVSLAVLRKMMLDGDFPEFREVNGCLRCRQWQLDLYLDGAYHDERSNAKYSTTAA
ncbi:MAG: helix-turn-helix domain-containing protein [Desulfomonilaceae bacterium]